MQAKPFVPNNQAVTRQGVSNNNKKDQPIDTTDAPVCFYHQTFDDRALTFFKLIGQSKAATLASGEITEARHGSAEAPFPSLSPIKLLYGAD